MTEPAGPPRPLRDGATRLGSLVGCALIAVVSAAVGAATIWLAVCAAFSMAVG